VDEKGIPEESTMTAFFEGIFESSLLSLLDFDSLEEEKKVGDRVAFVLDKYSIGDSNPAIGSPWERLGEVIKIEGKTYRVRWDNKHENTYNFDDLVLVRNRDRNNPNFLFAQKKNKRKKIAFVPFTR
jgi:hypothetical protein